MSSFRRWMRRGAGWVMAGLVLACAPAPAAESRKAGPLADMAAAIGKANAGVHRFVLDNGMIVLLKEDHSAPVVSLQIWVGTGSIHEHEYLGAGLSHAIEHMIFKGTKKRKPVDITREINNAGGDINAYTSLDRTVFFTDLPSEKWRVGLDVLSDAMMNAAFPEDEWKKEKEVIHREFAMGKDDPERVIDKLLWATAYTTHPYRIPVIGHEDIFRRITRNDLATFFSRHYVPDNMIVAMAGHFSRTEAEAEIRKAFAAFERRARPPQVLPAEPDQPAARFERKTGAYRISRLEWACHTVPLNHPDAAALDLLAVLGGQGRSSRLALEIKEKQKLVHSISAWSHTPKDPGLFGISATFSPENEAKVVAAIRDEVDRWGARRISADEVDKARRMVLSSELSALQTLSGQVSSLASGEFYAGDPRYSEVYLRRLGEVTPEKLRAVALKYLRPENRTVVVLSPEAGAGAAPAPVPGISIREPERTVLPDGIRVITRADPRLPLVHVCVAMKGGLLSETAGNVGVTRLTADLLTRGTAKRSGDDIAREVESLGATLRPFATPNGFGLQGVCLRPDVEAFLEIVFDCLRNAAFPDEEVEKQKAVQQAAIDQQQERPFFLAQEELGQMIFPEHPYRWNPLGKKETVRALGRGDLAAHYRKHRVAGNLAVAFFGDVSPAEAEAMARKGLAGIPPGPAPVYSGKKAVPSLPARMKRREPKEQAVLLMGFPGVTIRDPRYDALVLLQTAMSGLSSTIGVAVREDRGLAYYVGAYQVPGVDPGAYVVYAGTREDAVAEVERLMGEEMKRITSAGLSEEEMERARSQIIADYAMSLQDNAGLAVTCALNELYGLGYRHAFTTVARFRALTREDVRKAAASLFSDDQKAVSMVLPEAKADPEAKPVSRKEE